MTTANQTTAALAHDRWEVLLLRDVEGLEDIRSDLGDDLGAYFAQTQCTAPDLFAATSHTLRDDNVVLEINGVPTYAVTNRHPLLPLLWLTARWGEMMDQMRPAIIENVRLLFSALADAYKPELAQGWDDAYLRDRCQETYDKPDLCDPASYLRRALGTESDLNYPRESAGGTWKDNAMIPFLTVLSNIGMTDEEIGDVLLPIHERNLAAAREPKIHNIWARKVGLPELPDPRARMM